MVTNIYFINKLGTAVYKIGITNNLPRRLRQIQTAVDHPLVLPCYIEFSERSEARAEEKRIHDWVKDKRLVGEWFDLEETDLDELAKKYDLRNNDDV